MDLLTKLTPIDLVIVASLALGVFAGFTQGFIRYLLNVVVVIVAFIVASQLRDPLYQVLGFWEAFTPDLRRQILFLVVFVGLTVAGWFIVGRAWHGTRLPIAKQLDEIGGAVMGLLFAALSIVLTLVVMDSYFKSAPDASIAGSGPLKNVYDAFTGSVLVDFFRSTLIPTIGQVAKPFVPLQIAEFLKRP